MNEETGLMSIEPDVWEHNQKIRTITEEEFLIYAKQAFAAADKNHRIAIRFTPKPALHFKESWMSKFCAALTKG